MPVPRTITHTRAAPLLLWPPTDPIAHSFFRRDSKNKRRQSAPPIGQEFDPNATRNPEYIRALETFNEWRNQHLDNIGNGQSSSTGNTAGHQLPQTIPEDKPMITARAKAKSGNRLSLPAGTITHDVLAATPQGSGSKSKNRRDRRTTTTKNHQLLETSIMEEEGHDKEDDVRQFEQQHCFSAVGTFDLSGDEYSSSPPTRFYKKNAKPYHERLFSKTPTASTSPDKSAATADIEYSTPQRRNNAPTKPTRRKKSSAQSGPIPKIRNSLNCSKPKVSETDSMSEVSHMNGSYKNYDINSSSIYDECVISSKGYKGNLNKSTLTYQQVLNKHGDLVEYALPLMDGEKTPQPAPTTLEKNNKTPTTSNGQCLSRNHSQVIEENFKFLTDKCNLNFSDSVCKFIYDEPVASPGHATKQLQVTDLDMSERNKAGE